MIWFSVHRLSKVHVYLEGGRLCDSDEACLARCDQDNDGQVDNGLCTGPVNQVGSAWFKKILLILYFLEGQLINKLVTIASHWASIVSCLSLVLLPRGCWTGWMELKRKWCSSIILLLTTILSLLIIFVLFHNRLSRGVTASSLTTKPTLCVITGMSSFLTAVATPGPALGTPKVLVTGTFQIITQFHFKFQPYYKTDYVKPYQACHKQHKNLCASFSVPSTKPNGPQFRWQPLRGKSKWNDSVRNLKLLFRSLQITNMVK